MARCGPLRGDGAAMTRRRDQEHTERTLIACALRDIEAARRLTPRVHPLMFVSSGAGAAGRR